jgi:type I restriction enzyme S subunit
LKYAATINDEVLGEDTPPDLKIAYVDISNVDSIGTIHDIVDYAFEKAPSRARRVVRDGDVIISTVRTYLQAIASVKDPPSNLIVSTGFAVLRPRIECLEPGFCKYALRESRFLWEVMTRSVGISYPAINASDLGDIRISLPHLEMQRWIAAYLDRETARIDALIAEKARSLTLLAEKRQALITHAVTRGLNSDAPLRDSGLPWLGAIPEHWETLRAKYLWHEKHVPIRETDEIVTCFRDGQVTLRRNRREDGYTNAVKELGYQGVRAGHLVVHSMDAFAGAIGVSDADGKCTPEYIILEPTTDKVHNLYYGLLLRVMALSGYIQAYCPAVRERAPRIHYADLGSMYFPVPNMSEQVAIMDYIRRAEADGELFRAKTARTLELLRERRSALISEAVTGRVCAEE